MNIRERVRHKIVHGKWGDMMKIEEEWRAFEEEIGGFPIKRRSRPISGRDGMSVYVWERDWESMAQMEKAYESYRDDSGDRSDLVKRTEECIKDRNAEILLDID